MNRKRSSITFAEDSMAQAVVVFHRFRSLFFFIAFFGIFADIFFYKIHSGILLIILSTIWLCVVMGFKVRSNVSMIFGTGLLAISSIFYLYDQTFIVDKLIIWGFSLLSVGVIQTLYEEHASDTNTITSYQFIKQILADEYILFLRQKSKQLISPFIKEISSRWLDLLDNIRNPNPKSIRDFFLNCIKLLLLTTLLVAIIAILLYFLYVSISFISREAYALHRSYQRLLINPKIKTIQPHLVYPATKIVIHGSNFGWKQNEHVRLMKQHEEVSTDFWTDEKIILTVPQHWRAGEIKLWIEKDTMWDGKKVTATSQVESISLLPIHDIMNTQDDAYVEQLKHIDRETLELNGYNYQDH